MSGISAKRLSAVTEGWFAPPSEADIAQRWVDVSEGPKDEPASAGVAALGNVRSRRRGSPVHAAGLSSEWGPTHTISHRWLNRVADGVDERLSNMHFSPYRPATPVTDFVSTSNTRTQNNTKDVPSGVVASWTRAAHVSSQVRTCQRKNFVGWHCGPLTIDHYLYILITEPALRWAAVLHVTT
jgi:hypothetical protein